MNFSFYRACSWPQGPSHFCLSMLAPAGSLLLLWTLLPDAREAGRCCRADVDEECRRNRQLGEAIGCWRGGYLVEDDAGSVRKALAEPNGQ